MGTFRLVSCLKSQMKLLAVLVVTLLLGSCARPGDHPVSSNCSWTEEDNHTLNLQTLADRHHLRDDAVTAEDVAIRWADQRFPRRPEYGARRDECMESLFNGVARQHAVDVALVRQYSQERDILADSAAILSFALLFVAAVYYLVGRIRRRFNVDESVSFWIMTAVMSVGASLVGLFAGILWSIAFETYRLNSAHLSYRMNRIPSRQYWFVFLVCGILVFWLIALIRSRLSSMPKVST
jgi:hypothetical protein